MDWASSRQETEDTEGNWSEKKNGRTGALCSTNEARILF